MPGSRRRTAAAASRPEPRRDPTQKIIVIDPGHGGIEQGAVGPTGLQEKDVTLDLARRLKALLQTRPASISVVLTRDEDRLVGLDERTAIANHNQADLFLSIHLNASPRPAPGAPRPISCPPRPPTTRRAPWPRWRTARPASTEESRPRQARSSGQPRPGAVGPGPEPVPGREQRCWPSRCSASSTS